MRNWNNGNNWDFARWLRNVSRNAKANLSAENNGFPYDGESSSGSAEIELYRQVIKYFCNIEEETSSCSSDSSSVPTGEYTVTGTRPWLYQRLFDKATVSGYSFNADLEPPYVIIRALEVIARDLIAIPLSAEETAYLATLDFMPVNETEHAEGDAMHRAFGSQPGFGGVIGSREGETVLPSSSSEESSETSEESSETSEESSETSEESSASE